MIHDQLEQRRYAVNFSDSWVPVTDVIVILNVRSFTSRSTFNRTQQASAIELNAPNVQHIQTLNVSKENVISAYR